MKVLVADDDPGTRRVMSHQVETWGYKPVVASDGQEAWDILLEKDPPRIALLDWMMPRLDGVSLCQRLSEREKEHFVYSILMTVRSGAKDLIFALENGAHVFLRKPLCLDELHCQLRIGERLVHAYDMNLEYAHRVEQLAMTDPLTEIFNRYSWFDRAEQEVHRALRNQHDLSLLFIDLDRFKSINDTYGHTSGDTVLKQMVRQWRTKLRDYDIFGRFGGEEFVVLLPETSLVQAEEIARRLCEASRELQITTAKGDIRVTASIGVAGICSEGDSLEAMVYRADEAMYMAKDSGRDTVVVAEAPVEVTNNFLSES